MALYKIGKVPHPHKNLLGTSKRKRKKRKRKKKTLIPTDDPLSPMNVLPKTSLKKDVDKTKYQQHKGPRKCPFCDIVLYKDHILWHIKLDHHDNKTEFNYVEFKTDVPITGATVNHDFPDGCPCLFCEAVFVDLNRAIFHIQGCREKLTPDEVEVIEMKARDCELDISRDEDFIPKLIAEKGHSFRGRTGRQCQFCNMVAICKKDLIWHIRLNHKHRTSEFIMDDNEVVPLISVLSENLIPLYPDFHPCVHCKNIYPSSSTKLTHSMDHKQKNNGFCQKLHCNVCPQIKHSHRLSSYSDDGCYIEMYQCSECGIIYRDRMNKRTAEQRCKRHVKIVHPDAPLATAVITFY